MVTMTRLAALVLLAVLAWMPVGAQAQTLWRDIPAGATVEQVQKLIPAATAPEKVSELLNGTYKGLLVVEGFQLADVPFTATIYFRNGLADRVFLRPVTELKGQDARVAAIKIRDSLMTKYGKPLTEEKTKNVIATGEHLTWSSQQVLIRYMFDQYGDDSTGFIAINYSANADSGNL